MASKTNPPANSSTASTKISSVKKTAKATMAPPAKKSDALPKRTRKKVGAERQTAEKRSSQKSSKKITARASTTRAGSKKVRSASGKKKANTTAAARRTKRGKKRAT